MNQHSAASFFLFAAGLCIVGLLLMPGVHASMIVIHGPITALRSFRFAALIHWLLQASLMSIAALLPPLGRLVCRNENAGSSLSGSLPSSPLFLDSPLRC